MTHILWSQDFFAKGELSPLMYSRITLNAYYQGLKRAKNVLCLPQGSAGKRFGTRFVTKLTGLTNYRQIFFKSFQYLNECCYLLVFYNDSIAIYLEDNLVATVTGTGIMADEIQLIDHTVLDNRFRVTTGIYQPKDLIRTPNSPLALTVVGNTFTVAVPQTAGFVYPARFTAAVMPTTTPQIHANKTYFIRFITTTTFKAYSTAEEAAADINAYTVSSAGTTPFVIIQNTWAFSNVTFKNRPVFDFTGGYDTSEFTPAAVSGYSVNITRTSGTFNMTANYIGGAFIGNGGIARITNTNGTDIITVSIIQPFDSTAAIPGSAVLLAEPAWSDLRGWPRVCSSFQNRAFFGNTELLSNGLWASVVNQFDDFDDLEKDSDNAISWYPTSDNVNYINFIVPYRSLTVHTNSGVYSTPLSVETAITPNNFSLSLQDSTPADRVQPAGLDNQIIVLSGNDAHSLLWDGFNNAYTSSIISIANEQLLRTPIDEAPYVDKVRGGSRYMFIINLDGTMAIYQTLISENVSGFTDAELEQSYGNAYFRWVTSNFDGRAWFVTEREIGVADTPESITGFTSDSFEAAYVFPTDTFTAVSFAGTVLPTTSPQIVSDHIYWAVGVDATHFKIYLTQEDALADENAYEISDAGTSATVTPYPLETQLFIEQLDFDAQMDCVGYYDGSATSLITGQDRFNGQEVLMQGDGFGFSDWVENGNVYFEAHGELREVSEAQYGFPIDVEIQPLPLSIALSGNAKSSNLIESKHLRFATFLFADTIGGTISDGNNVTPIAMNTLLQNEPGSPPVPTTGSFEMSLFGGWNDFNYNAFTINHREPFGMKLTGIFYRVDA
jgi:hypothetical protein